MITALDIWRTYRYLKIATNPEVRVVLDMLDIPQLDNLHANLLDVLNIKRLNKKALNPGIYLPISENS